MVADLFKYVFLNKKLEIWKSGILLFSSIFIIFITWAIIGYFTINNYSNYGGRGYGYYTYNLSGIINSAGFSNILPNVPISSYGQNTEGFSYLGISILLLLMTSLILFIYKCIVNKKIPKEVKLFYPLIIVSVLLALFAISHIVTFNGHVLFQIPVSDDFLIAVAPFRASGRFFWVLYYLLFLFALIVPSLHFKNKKITLPLIFVFLLVLHLYDIYPLMNRWKTDKYNKLTLIETKQIESIVDNYDNIVMYPPFVRSYNKDYDYTAFAYLAAQKKKTINAGYIARFDRQKAKQIKKSLTKDIEKGNFRSNNLYIYTEQSQYLFLPHVKNKLIKCTNINNYFICSTK